MILLQFNSIGEVYASAEECQTQMEQSVSIWKEWEEERGVLWPPYKVVVTGYTYQRGYNVEVVTIDSVDAGTSSRVASP